MPFSANDRSLSKNETEELTDICVSLQGAILDLHIINANVFTTSNYNEMPVKKAMVAVGYTASMPEKNGTVPTLELL